MNEPVDFSQFLSALQEFRRDDTQARPTAHTSSVSTKDWHQVEQALSANNDKG